MQDRRSYTGLLLALLIALPLLGVATSHVWPVGTPLGFRTEIFQTFGNKIPYTGALVVTINKDGIVNGIYEADSVRPDPLYGRKTPVTGGANGSNINLQIGSGPNALTIRGTYANSEISGNVTGLSGIWSFRGTRVHLHNPPQQT